MNLACFKTFLLIFKNIQILFTKKIEFSFIMGCFHIIFVREEIYYIHISQSLLFITFWTYLQSRVFFSVNISFRKKTQLQPGILNWTFRYHYIFIYCAFFKDLLITSACTFFISFHFKLKLFKVKWQWIHWENVQVVIFLFVNFSFLLFYSDHFFSSRKVAFPDEPARWIL